MDLMKPYRLIREIIALPRIEIRLWGDAYCYQLYRTFVRPHPRYWVIQSKSIGAAILPLPATFEEYISGKPNQALRTNRTRSLKLGCSFHVFSPQEHLDDLMEINLSSPIRQGREMYSSLTDFDRVKQMAEQIDEMLGVFDQENRLRAYAHMLTCGELTLFSSLLGHAQFLDQGIMYLLVSESIKVMIARQLQDGLPRFAMYDTFLGALPGLRYFKERLGFKPYWVKWTWSDKTLV